MMFLKIITFPIRLILFLAIAAVSGIMLMLNNTIGMLCCVASGIVKALGVGFMILCIGNFLITYIRNYDTMSVDTPVWEAALFLGLLLVVMAVFYFMPVIAQVIFTWVEMAVMWLWGLAKTVLFCRNCF